MSDDHALLQQLKDGDKAAFATLVTQYSQRVLNTCYRFLLDKADAEDAAQEVFITVFQSIQAFRGESSLSTWIYRIAVTKCLDELKKRKRKRRISSLGKLLHLDDVAHWLVGDSMPDQALLESENLQAITQALDTLPDSQRVAFTLSKIDGYTNPEIAELLDTTIVAVESLIYRAKKNVSDQLVKIFKK